MKPETDYILMILQKFEDWNQPSADLQELGFDLEDPRFLFHMRLLTDEGYIVDLDGVPTCGFTPFITGTDGTWNIFQLRLTRAGHDAVVLLGNPSKVEMVKAGIKNFGVGFLRSAVSKMNTDGVAWLIDNAGQVLQ